MIARLEVPTPRPARLFLQEGAGRVWRHVLLTSTGQELPLTPPPMGFESDFTSIRWVRVGLYTLEVTVRPTRGKFFRLEGRWEEENPSSARVELAEGEEATAFATPNRSVHLHWDGETLTAEHRR